MSAHGDNYVLDAGKSGHARLRAISEIHDERTRTLLLGAGLEAGDRYVEFGCGLGYVTRWARLDRCRRARYRSQRGSDRGGNRTCRGQTEFRVGSVYDHGLPPQNFDVSYSRWLLIHLNRPVDAMRSIYAALKPGGLMVCEEAEMSVIYSEPSSGYHEFVEFAFAAGATLDVDYAGGRRLHQWASEAGFTCSAPMRISRTT